MASKSRVEVYEDDSGSWRWRIHGNNGAVVASSNESFHTKGNAKRAARNVVRLASSLAGADPVVVDG